MSKNNQCFVVGNLGMDPQERARTEKAGPIVGFSVAENVQQYDAEAKEYKTLHTNWFNVTAFGNIGERAKRGLRKGDKVAIHGRMKVSRFTDKSGEERSGFEIIADEIAIWKPLASAHQNASSQPGSAEAGNSKEDLPF
jgi:single-strand DNA-binding protein